jgi:hypothetical protein
MRMVQAMGFSFIPKALYLLPKYRSKSSLALRKGKPDVANPFQVDAVWQKGR